MSKIEERRTTTGVAIVSSNYLLRLGLQKIVEHEPWIRLIGQAAHGANLDDILTRERPHIMIVDSEIESDVTELIQKIKVAAPGIKIILLSGIDDVERTRQALARGVDGLVLKIQPSPVLIATIDYLARPTGEAAPPAVNGTAHLEMAHVPAVSIATHPASAPSSWPESLTEREREIVQLIGQGLSNKDIADRLCISSITVRHHLTNIFDKLGVSNRQKLLLRAHQHGLVGSPASA